MLVYLVLFFPIAAITGGIAGAMVGGGREERPIWQNGLIGIVGWTVGAVVMAASTGDWLEGATLGLGFFALLASVAFILFDEWWGRRSHSASHQGSTL